MLYRAVSLMLLCAMVVSVNVGCASSSTRSYESYLTVQKVDYQHGDVKLQGVLAVNDYQGHWVTKPSPKHKRPAVLIIHEWWGLNEYAISRAKKLANENFIVFALDMYGQGKHSDNVEDAKAWSSEFYGKPLMAQRAQAGLDVLRKDPRVDPNNIYVIGYCFGGTAAVELAYSGADIKGAVSFHGTPAAPTPEQAAATKASLLILTGGSDPMFDAKARNTLAAGLEATDIDWSMIVYGHAKHSFTNPNSDKYNIPGVGYNKQADAQSWRAFHEFVNFPQTTNKHTHTKCVSVPTETD